MQSSCACPCDESEAKLNVKHQDNAIMILLTPLGEIQSELFWHREQRYAPLLMSFPFAKRSRDSQTNPCDLAYGRWSTGLHCAFLPMPKQFCCSSPLTVLPALDQPWWSPGVPSSTKAKSSSLRCSFQERRERSL